MRLIGSMFLFFWSTTINWGQTNIDLKPEQRAEVQMPTTASFLNEITYVSSSSPYQLDSLEVVADYKVDSKFRWILAWGIGSNYILIQQGENTIIRRSHEEGEEGHIIRSRFFQSKKAGLYYILSVFGMEDGDISLKVYGIEGNILHYYGNIPALSLDPDKEYTYVPLENLKLIEKQGRQLDILFPDEEYEIWSKGKLERWTGTLQYKLAEGQILRQK
ncbi:MAG: hypothetical protein F6K19_06755 [Cyanothece sp. SIO1E1]|nr:hypothetical protein [Cyanothece sp. SIO1E1]